MMKHAVCVNVEKKNPTMSIAISNTQVNVGVYACMPVCLSVSGLIQIKHLWIWPEIGLKPYFHRKFLCSLYRELANLPILVECAGVSLLMLAINNDDTLTLIANVQTEFYVLFIGFLLNTKNDSILVSESK